ncbi:extensin-like [Ctenocephalides felis]|uniref:extensin-like n=1 Tax=Ctenocephalides felis TaxID=7515 RepID=UPI000E6E3E83|nr:extensin-like [Ctenocephalides felis]
MAHLIAVFLATIAVANAGFIDAPGHLAYTGDYYDLAGLGRNFYAGPAPTYGLPVVKSPSKTVDYSSTTVHPVPTPIFNYAPIQATYGAPAQTYGAPLSIQTHVLGKPIVSKNFQYATSTAHPVPAPVISYSPIQTTYGVPAQTYSAPVFPKPIISKNFAYSSAAFHPVEAPVFSYSPIQSTYGVPEVSYEAPFTTQVSFEAPVNVPASYGPPAETPNTPTTLPAVPETTSKPETLPAVPAFSAPYP